MQGQQIKRMDRQCSPELKNKLEGTSGYDSAKADKGNAIAVAGEDKTTLQSTIREEEGGGEEIWQQQS